MRKRNWRLLVVGLVLIAAAIAFFFGMQTLVPRSNDPVELMRTVGQVSGAVGGIGVVMLIFGLIGRRANA